MAGMREFARARFTLGFEAGGRRRPERGGEIVGEEKFSILKRRKKKKGRIRQWEFIAESVMRRLDGEARGKGREGEREIRFTQKRTRSMRVDSLARYRGIMGIKLKIKLMVDYFGCSLLLCFAGLKIECCKFQTKVFQLLNQ